MRRALPFQECDLVAILNWCCASESVSKYYAPISHITRALERYAQDNPISPDLREAMVTFASQLRSSRDREAMRLGTKVEQLYGVLPETKADATRAEERKSAPQPAPAGSPAVLDQLKRWLGLPLAADQAPTTRWSPTASRSAMTHLFVKSTNG
jgi:hypothetical protein